MPTVEEAVADPGVMQGGAAGMVDPWAILNAQLAGQAGDNPGIALLLQLMQKHAPSAAAKDDIVEIDSEPNTELPSLSNAEIATLVRASEEQSVELGALRARNDMLAAALGACHVCFGDDRWCLNCAGSGKPGSTRPDPSAYARFVKPLLRALRPAGITNGSAGEPGRSAG